jgi:hypothetical protein
VLKCVIPPLVAAAPEALILVATDPPDPLADVVRLLAPGVTVLSTGTWLDSLRFRTHLAAAFGVDLRSVQAEVLGEHGTSEVTIGPARRSRACRGRTWRRNGGWTGVASGTASNARCASPTSTSSRVWARATTASAS